MPRALLSVALLTLTGDALTASSQVSTQSRDFLCKVQTSFARVSKLSVSVMLAYCNAALLSSYFYGSICQPVILPACLPVYCCQAPCNSTAYHLILVSSQNPR